MNRRIRFAAILCWSALAWSVAASAQTRVGTVVDGASEAFFFDLTSPGQARFNLTWDDAPDVLSLIVACDDGFGGTLVFGTSISAQSRVATLDVGILPDVLCIASVDIFVGFLTDFALNLQVTDPNGLVLENTRFRAAGDTALLEEKERRLVDDLAARSAALRAAFRAQRLAGQEEES